MFSEKPFYVYVHRKATDGSVFYVGKGKGNRAFSKSRRNKYWYNTVRKHDFTVHIVMHFNKEICAFSFERALIKHYGRENLCNLTDGGDGASGHKHSDETKEILSRLATGKSPSDETRKKLSLANIGREKSEKTRMLLSISNTGKSPTLETRLKIGIGNKGKTITNETRLKISISSKGKVHSKDAILKMSQSKCKKVRTKCGMKFESVKSAISWLKLNGYPSASVGGISPCLNGKYKMAYGFVWEYDTIDTV